MEAINIPGCLCGKWFIEPLPPICRWCGRPLSLETMEQIVITRRRQETEIFHIDLSELPLPESKYLPKNWRDIGHEDGGDTGNVPKVIASR